ncbi:MAG: terpene cyclase/mutase family protein [Candidatus Wallbacteria bacterium]|nr:terpene cyclase/mutase family protein [Candidatus Wallbacteria bacterium]
MDTAREWLDSLFVYSDRIRLALTLGETVSPSLGFECFLGSPDLPDPRWNGFLDHLVERELCSEGQRERVLGWPAVLLPSSVRSPWPERLMIDALLESPTQLGWIDCRISHVKVVLNQDQPPAAKAYVGFVQVWEPLASGGPPLQVPSAPRRTGSPSLDVTMEGALSFLLSSRTQAGWWTDYAGFDEGVSDEWVTAYVANAIDETGDSRARQAARRAWSLLKQRVRDGWGWNYVQPADADSTLWVLQLASRLGELQSPRAQRGLTFLRRHLQPDGGVATYLSDHRSEWSSRAHADPLPVNPAWYDGHTCVTAACAAFEPMGPEPLKALRRQQADDGSWKSYWWQSAAYCTAHAAEALACNGAVDDRDRVVRAAEWARHLLDSGTVTPFERALTLRVLLARPKVADASELQRLLKPLSDSQAADGGWTSSAVLAIPNAAGRVVLAHDRLRLFTTATVLRTLCRVRSSEVSNEPVR